MTFVDSSAIIGAAALAYTWDGEKYVEKPQMYSVRIGDDVFIGALSVIVKGSWRNTTIGDDTKIANRVTVGHNVIIGKHCLIAPGVVLCGSCEIGDNTRIYSNSVIHQRIKVGKNCIIGPLKYIKEDVKDCSSVL